MKGSHVQPGTSKLNPGQLTIQKTFSSEEVNLLAENAYPKHEEWRSSEALRTFSSCQTLKSSDLSQVW